mmetsp:Transcript_110454/g.312416  ORF Transcript_110454/g.312416 Transcript_110454/m.312416 type:complete len:81 (-) Transcript_110454:458-700(-)
MVVVVVTAVVFGSSLVAVVVAASVTIAVGLCNWPAEPTMSSAHTTGGHLLHSGHARSTDLNAAMQPSGLSLAWMASCLMW